MFSPQALNLDNRKQGANRRQVLKVRVRCRKGRTQGRLLLNVCPGFLLILASFLLG